MILTVAAKREFIPEFNDNKKAIGSEQIKIIHRPATINMKEDLFPHEFSYGADGKVQGSFAINRKKIISAFVIELININYKFDGEKDEVKKVKTVDDLFLAPPEYDPLIDEMYSYFQDMLNNKVNEKNSV